MEREGERHAKCDGNGRDMDGLGWGAIRSEGNAAVAWKKRE